MDHSITILSEKEKSHFGILYAVCGRIGRILGRKLRGHHS